MSQIIVDEGSFHPGLRIAYVEYCKAPPGQGGKQDPAAPKMSQSQFFKLLQDVGVAEPEGPVPLNTLSSIFASYKPLGGARFLFPHFYRALGAVSKEARQDVVQLVANLGSRAVDLQYLSSIRLFPDKQAPYVLFKGDVGMAPCPCAKRSVSPSRQSPSARISLSGGMPSSGTMPFSASGGVVGGSGRLRPTTAPSAYQRTGSAPLTARSTVSPRDAWKSEDFHVPPVPPPMQPGVPNVFPVTPGLQMYADSPHARTPMGAPGSHLRPPNAGHLESWGAWEPYKSDGYVPAWLAYLFDKVDYLERELMRAQGGGISPAEKDALARTIEASATTSAVAAANEVVRPVLAHAMALEGQVAEALAKVAVISELETNVKGLGDLNAKVDNMEEKVEAVAAMKDELEGASQRMVGTLGMLTERLQGTSEAMGALSDRVEAVELVKRETSEGLEAVRQGYTSGLETATKGYLDGLDALRKQVRELEAEVATTKDSLAKSTKRVLEDAAVDRAQLLTTTNMMDQTYQSVEGLKTQVADLEASLREVKDVGSSLTEKIAALQPRVDSTEKALKEVEEEAAAGLEEANKKLRTVEGSMRVVEGSVKAIKEGDSMPALLMRVNAQESATQELMGALQTAAEKLGIEIKGINDALVNDIARVSEALGSDIKQLSDVVNNDMQRNNEAVKADLQRVDLELKATGDALAKGIAENKGSIGALEETVVANLKRTVDDAAVDRAQLLAASNLIGQLFEAVELMKPEVNMATAEVKVLREYLNQLAASGGAGMAPMAPPPAAPVKEDTVGAGGPGSPAVVSAVKAMEAKLAASDLELKNLATKVRELEGTLEDIGAKDRGLPTRARSVGLSNTGGGSSGGTADVPAGAVAELKQKISELQSQIQVEAEKGSSARAIADNRLTDLEQKVSQVLPSPGNSPMAGGLAGSGRPMSRLSMSSGVLQSSPSGEGQAGAVGGVNNGEARVQALENQMSEIKKALVAIPGAESAKLAEALASAGAGGSVSRTAAAANLAQAAAAVASGSIKQLAGQLQAAKAAAGRAEQAAGTGAGAVQAAGQAGSVAEEVAKLAVKVAATEVTAAVAEQVAALAANGGAGVAAGTSASVNPAEVGQAAARNLLAEVAKRSGHLAATKRAAARAKHMAAAAAAKGAGAGAVGGASAAQLAQAAAHAAGAEADQVASVLSTAEMAAGRASQVSRSVAGSASAGAGPVSGAAMLAHTTQALAELVAEEAEKLSSDIAAAEAAAARVEQMMAASSGAGAGDSAAVAQAGQAVAEEMHRLSDRMAAADVAAACLEQMAAAAGSQGAAGNPALAAQIQAAQAAAQAIAGEVAKLSSNYAEAPLQQQVSRIKKALGIVTPGVTAAIADGLAAGAAVGGTAGAGSNGVGPGSTGAGPRPASAQGAGSAGSSAGAGGSPRTGAAAQLALAAAHMASGATGKLGNQLQSLKAAAGKTEQLALTAGPGPGSTSAPQAAIAVAEEVETLAAHVVAAEAAAAAAEQMAALAANGGSGVAGGNGSNNSGPPAPADVAQAGARNIIAEIQKRAKHLVAAKKAAARVKQVAAAAAAKGAGAGPNSPDAASAAQLVVVAAHAAGVEADQLVVDLTAAEMAAGRADEIAAAAGAMTAAGAPGEAAMLALTSQAMAEQVAVEAEKLSADIAAAEAAAARVDQLMAAAAAGESTDSAALAEAAQAVSDEMESLAERMAAVEATSACIEQLAAAAATSSSSSPGTAGQVRAAQAASQAVASEVAQLSARYLNSKKKAERAERAAKAARAGLDAAAGASGHQSSVRQVGPTPGSVGGDVGAAGGGDVGAAGGSSASAGGLSGAGGSLGPGGGSLMKRPREAQTTAVEGPAGEELVRLKISLNGILDALDEAHTRISELEVVNTALNTTVGGLRTASLEANMKLLQGAKGGVVDDTVASQAEVEALSEKVQQLDNLVVESLSKLNMVEGITRAARASTAGELSFDGPQGFAARSGRLSLAQGSPGSFNGSSKLSAAAAAAAVSSGGSLTGSPVPPGTPGGESALRTLNPHRDKLAAAILEIDRKVEALDSSHRMTKSQQDTFKQRLNELAEALVNISNKVQARLSKTESQIKKLEAKTKDLSTGEEGEESNRNNMGPQGLARVIHKRIDDIESRLTRAELESGRGVRLQIQKELTDIATALNEVRTEMNMPEYIAPPIVGPAPGGVELASQKRVASQGGAALAAIASPEEIQALEADLQGLGKDVVALHAMLQQTEAALRQELAPLRDDLVELEARVDEKLALKEEVLLKLARQLDLVSRKQRESFAGVDAAVAAAAAVAASTPKTLGTVAEE